MNSLLNEDSTLKDFLTALNDVNKSKSKKNDNYIGNSIASYSKNLVMSFPVLFDDTLSLETAQMISKANERNIVTMLQMLFSSMSIEGNKGAEIIAALHKNINESLSFDDMDMEEIMEAMDRICEDADLDELSAAQIRDAANEMCYQIRQPKKVFAESFSERSLNDYRVSNIYGRTLVTEATKEERDQEKYEYEKSRRAAQEDREKNKEDREKRKEEREENRDRNKDDRDEITLKNNLAARQILDGDFKKANELQPTTMIINMNSVDKDGKPYDRVSFVAGVKCRLINAGALDIVERIVAKNKSKLSFKNLLRATTGEISFISDFILCVKQAKINAKNAVKKGEAAKMWNTLEKRATKNNINKIGKERNDATAITTLVINQETANYMKSAYGIDMMKVADAKAVMDAYNLLCLVIADDSIEAARFLYDGNNTYEVVSYSSLTRDNKDDAYRKALNTLTRR